MTPEERACQQYLSTMPYEELLDYVKGRINESEHKEELTRLLEEGGLAKTREKELCDAENNLMFRGGMIQQPDDTTSCFLHTLEAWGI